MRQPGFTLLEVLVALAIVALGMGALLAALTSSAGNVQALREKTLAQWIALNQVADARLNLQAPQLGTTQGDVNNFGNSNWHWQRTVTSVGMVPGLLQITVGVRRNPPSGIAAPAKPPDWITSVVGFRGDALSAATGDQPDWTGTGFTSSPASSSSSSSSSSSGAGNVANPGTSLTAPGTGSPGTTNPTTNSSGAN